ncbi:MAG TPA: nuclear transport factor 2 family protein [Solirubrobacteraceae bacterium]|jgi:ketosteroid isomerase-like protein|nr:nuclear transport factor 2 family protein [Solirubrobacteraceae bacterium]
MSAPTAVKSTRQVVEEAYGAMNTGNGEAFAALLADDVVVMECDHHPCPGTWSNKAELLDAFPTLAASLGLRAVHIRALIVDGDRAAAEIAIECTSKSGKEYSVDACETWKVRDGLVVAIRPYYWDVTALAETAAS